MMVLQCHPDGFGVGEASVDDNRAKGILRVECEGGLQAGVDCT